MEEPERAIQPLLTPPLPSKAWALAAGLDGTIYIGESERISKWYLFYPW